MYHKYKILLVLYIVNIKMCNMLLTKNVLIWIQSFEVTVLSIAIAIQKFLIKTIK